MVTPDCIRRLPRKVSRVSAAQEDHYEYTKKWAQARARNRPPVRTAARLGMGWVRTAYPAEISSASAAETCMRIVGESASAADPSPRRTLLQGSPPWRRSRKGRSSAVCRRRSEQGSVDPRPRIGGNSTENSRRRLDSELIFHYNAHYYSIPLFLFANHLVDIL